MLEAGEPLTVDALRSEYRSLLVKYFGPSMVLEEHSDLECLRIPHFYNAFYVYKYSTGISASIALSARVRNGGAAERDDYFAFLRSGGSRFPIESLRAAGVDLSSPGPVVAACAEFAGFSAELKRLMKL
jgi:oligoendopeptidase F